MVTVDSNGDYRIVTGTESEILTELNNDGVDRHDVAGFHRLDSTTLTVLYKYS